MLRRLTILFHIAGLETEYQMSGFFPVDHKHNAFGVPSSAYSRRRLKHQASIYAPLLSSGHECGRLRRQRCTLPISTSRLAKVYVAGNLKFSYCQLTI